MQKIIGLDIGSYSIKAVEIINTFKSYEISNFYENVIPDIEEISADSLLPTCMEQLFVENNLQADRIVTAMPGQYISSRVLSFAFSDPRKIQAAVLGEVEDAVPFNLDEMIIDHQLLGSRNDRTMALAVMTKKNFLASFLEHLQRIDIDPKLVDVDSLAFYNLFPYLNTEPGKCYGLIDVGHEKTSVCVIQDGVLRMFRSINLGGRYMTEFLSRDLELDFNEAQRVKHGVSQVLCSADRGDGLDKDEKLVARRITLAANAIVKELGRTMYAFKTWEKSPIDKIFLSGGTSQIVNFDNYLVDHLETPVERMDLSNSELKLNPNLDQRRNVMPQSVAIGLRAVSSVKRHSQVNLRKGEFAYVQNYEAVMKTAGGVFKALAFGLLILATSYGVQRYFYGKQIDKLQGIYKSSFLALFPDAKKNYKNPKRYTFASMRQDANARLNTAAESKNIAADEFIEANSQSPALVALQELSQSIDKDTVIDLTLYAFSVNQEGVSSIQLRGETTDFATSTAILEKIKGAKGFYEVEEKDSRPKAGNKEIIEFTILSKFKVGGQTEENI